MQETTKQLAEVFKTNQRYTIYRISEMMAWVTKQEITVNIVDLENGRVIFTPRGKRKHYILPLEGQHYTNGPLVFFKGAVFAGWDQPIKCDTETPSGVMRGNACYNFIGTPEAVRAWIDAGQLNPIFDKAAVLAINNRAEYQRGEETVVYPELVVEGNHAVIDRVLAQTE